MDNISSKESLVIGADIGGTHVTSALVNLKGDCVVPGSKVRLGVNANGSAEDILEVWVSAIGNVIKKFPLFSGKVGVAMPGPFDYSAGVCLIKGMNKYESLYGLNIRTIFSERLEIAPENIIFRNDAEAFLHGEVCCGAAKGFSSAFGITLGTGLGSAYSSDGVTTDANLGVSPLYDGIAEDYISTRWFLKRYEELTGKKVKDVKTLTEVVNTKDVEKIFLEFSGNVAAFLNNIIPANKPQIVVIGGNIAKAHYLFWSKFQQLIAKDCQDTVFAPTKLWEDAALVGAACCFEISGPTPQLIKAR